MRIIATPIISSELQPGDLFSVAGPFYRDTISDMSNYKTIGQKVYIRTACPCPDDQKDVKIFKISIEK